MFSLNYQDKFKFFLIFIFLFFLLFPVSVIAEKIEGRVVSISDGDTISVLTAGNKLVKVRLAEIDTPESSQPYGSKSKQKLSDLVFYKIVSVDVSDKDRYGRSIGRVFVDNIDVNALMVEIGAAWVYRQYAKDQSLFALEEKAKELKLGLWSLPESERVPPWEWRKLKKGSGSGVTVSHPDTTQPVKEPQKSIDSTPVNSGFSCGGKTKCGQMSSCAEAMFYLNNCGLTRLDRDRDGIPCESICR